MRTSALVVAILVLTPPALIAQETRKSLEFGTESAMVRLSVAVTAQLKEPLTDTDFTVYDNGAKQDVASFAVRSLPADIWLFVDTSGSLSIREMPADIIRLRPGIVRSAKQFVNILKPGDRMEVVDFSSRILTLQVLTGDKDLLLSAIDRLDIRCTAEEYSRSLFCPGGGRTLLARTLYLTLDELKRLPRDPGHPRRRVLIFITDGVDTGSNISEDVLRKNTRQAETSIYMLALQPSVSAKENTEEMRTGAQSRWLMEKLCHESGGAFLPADTPRDLERLAERVSAEMAAEYTVGWVPITPKGKDPWHTIQVAVKNVPSNQLRYRSGYLSSAMP